MPPVSGRHGGHHPAPYEPRFFCAAIPLTSAAYPPHSFGVCSKCLLGGAEVTPYSTVDSGTRLSLQERCHVVLDPQLGTLVDHELLDVVHGCNSELRIYVDDWDSFS